MAKERCIVERGGREEGDEKVMKEEWARGALFIYREGNQLQFCDASNKWVPREERRKESD